jgi:hypothetical protein
MRTDSTTELRIKVTWPESLSPQEVMAFHDILEAELTIVANQIKTLLPGAIVEGIHVG